MNKKINTKKSLLLVLIGSAALFACNGGGSAAKSGYHTLNTYLSTNPKTWNVHDWETNDESYIPSFTEIGFYDVTLNENKSGYQIITEMASEFPVDATEDAKENEDLEKYGFAGNVKSGRIWDIKLNKDAVWEDGTKITADDYVESMKLQLTSKYANFRADSYYASNFVIANAESFYKQGRDTEEPVYKYLNQIDKSTGNWVSGSPMGRNGQLYLNLNKFTPYVETIFGNADTETTLYTVLNNRSSSGDDNLELAAQRITDAVKYYTWKHLHANDKTDEWKDVKRSGDVKETMLDNFIEVYEFDDKEVFVRNQKDRSFDKYDYELKQYELVEGAYEKYSFDALKKDLSTVVAGLGRSANTDTSNPKYNWKLPLFAMYHNTDEVSFDNVGIRKVDDYTFRLYLSQSMSLLDLKFALTSNWLVKTDLYKKLTSEHSTYYETDYASKKAENYMSYGPYKLKKFTAGSYIEMVKNENWYGYKDGKHNGQFETDAIKTYIYQEHSTAKNNFVAGKLDDLSLDRNDMKDFGNSSRLTTTPESYTQKISFNTKRSSLLKSQNATGEANWNKTVLANYDFRKGLSLSLDRNNFASQTTAGSRAFTGLLNEMYITNVTTGEMYRKTEQGKSVYGKIYGDLGDNPYADGYDPNGTHTALSESANGYAFEQATYYVAKGLAAELNSNLEGHLKSGDKIKIIFKVYDSTSDTTQSMKMFIADCFDKVIKAAVTELRKTTEFADLSLSFELEAVTDEDYYNSAKKGDYDMIFSIWGGAAIQPYNLMQVYCDATFESTCEYGFKGEQDKIQIGIDSDGDGVEEMDTYHSWFTKMVAITENDTEGVEDAGELAELEAENAVLHQEKLNILAGLEAGIINRFEAIPLVARGSSSLRSFKVENGTESYINLVGYGGIREMTYNMDDAEWEQFCKTTLNENSYKG